MKTEINNASPEINTNNMLADVVETREIKFRGFQKGWIYGGVSVFNNEATIYDINCMANSAFEVELETVGQYTGLKDKNGVDIYEGDILKTETDKLMVVGWSKKFASFILNRKDWTFSHWFGESCEAKNCEIVDNIHERKVCDSNVC